MDNQDIEKELEFQLPRVNEHAFLTKYLKPLLDNTSPDGKALWIREVSVRPYLRVEVVADHDHDEVLFWVPQPCYSPDTMIGSNMDQVTDAAQEMAVRKGISHADKFLKESLSGVIVAKEPPQEDIDQWRLILERYNLITASKPIEDKRIEYEEDDNEEW